MRTLIKNALVFDGHSEKLIADNYVGVENERIAHFAREPWGEKADRVIDLAGRILMPGLIDAHYHAYGGVDAWSEIEQLPITYLAHKARNMLEGALQRGFTTVRDVAGADYGLWRAIEDGEFAAPRLFFGGKALSQTGGHGDPCARHVEPCGCSRLPGILTQVVDGVEAVRVATREIMRRGAHHVKIMASGGLSSPTDPVWMVQYSADEIRAIVEEAARLRGYVCAHAYGADAISRAVELGVRSIEHGNLIDAAAAEVIRSHEAFVVPTLVAYDDLPGNEEEIGASTNEYGGLAAFQRLGMRAVETCAKAGVKLGFGTDLFGTLAPYQAHEFRLRGEVQKPIDVLRSATSINASLLKREGVLGCIRVDAFADLVAIDGNPLEDLSLLYATPSKIALVMKAGRTHRMELNAA